MGLDRKWTSVSAVLTIPMLTAPVLAFAASYAPYKPSTPPPPVRQQFTRAAPPPPAPVKQQFNKAAAPPLKQNFNNASGAATQSGKAKTTKSSQASSKSKSSQDSSKAKSKTRQNNPQVAARGLHNNQESKVPDVNARNQKNKTKTAPKPGTR